MPAPIHHARTCENCAHNDPDDGCLNSFPSDALTCTEHQTETEFEFFIHWAERAPVLETTTSMAMQ